MAATCKLVALVTLLAFLAGPVASQSRRGPYVCFNGWLRLPTLNPRFCRSRPGIQPRQRVRAHLRLLQQQVPERGQDRQECREEGREREPRHWRRPHPSLLPRLLRSGVRRFRSPDADQHREQRRREGRPSQQEQPARVRGDRRGQGRDRGRLPGRRLLRRRRRLRRPRRVPRPQQRPDQHPRAGGPPRRPRVLRKRDRPAPRALLQPRAAPVQLRRQGPHLRRDGHALRRAHHRPRPLRLRLRSLRRRGPGLGRQAQGAVQRRRQQLPEPGRRHAQRPGQAVLPERDRQESALQLGRRAPQLHGDHDAGDPKREQSTHVGEEVREGHGEHGQNRGHG